MSDANALHNRAVWFDIPVAELDRACAFYRAVLAIEVDIIDSDGFRFAVLAHDQGNGGCLVPNAQEITATQGIMVYLNVNGRIRDAVQRVSAHGGRVVADTHAIGPHGFRAVVIDSEGNRIVLHSESDG